MKSKFTQELPRSRCQRWLYGWFGSFFGITFTVLLADAIAAQWSGVSQVWTIVAWAAFISHVLAYAGMCFFVAAIAGASLSAICGAAAMRDKPNIVHEPHREDGA